MPDAYGPGMNTFWGCDTETMTVLGALFDERAGTLETLAEQIATDARLVDWIGPDAEDHRLDTDEVVETAVSLIERIRHLGELLCDEAEDQERASSPVAGDVYGASTRGGAGGPLSGILATPPRGPLLDGGPSGPLEEREPWWRTPVGGPGLVEDPETATKAFRKLVDLVDPEVIGPIIGGPLAAPWAPHRRPVEGPLPEGESFDLDPETLQRASEQRSRVTGGLPFVGTAEAVMELQQSTEGRAERWEQRLVDAGLEELTPLTEVVGNADRAMGIFLGEDSQAGQVLDGVDRMWANTQQTGGEVLSAVVDGDPAGALRAAERGAFRHGDAVADVLTATAIPVATDAGASFAEDLAGHVEHVSPEAAQTMRENAAEIREGGERFQQFQDEITDGETWYDRRRRYVPLPWDPTSAG